MIVHPVEIIHSRAAQVPVRHIEAGGLDDIDRHAKAGSQAQHGAGILRDIRLVDGETRHGMGHRRNRTLSSSERFAAASC